MPKNAKQLFALAVIGGLSALSANIAQRITQQEEGLAGFATTVAGGAVGAGLGLMVLNGRGARIA